MVQTLRLHLLCWQVVRILSITARYYTVSVCYCQAVDFIHPLICLDTGGTALPMLCCHCPLGIRGKYPHILYGQSPVFCFDLFSRCPLSLRVSFGKGVFPAHFFLSLLLSQMGKPVEQRVWDASGPASVLVHAQVTL